MISATGYRVHSADVSMRLLIDGVSLRIAQMGPEFFLIEADQAREPGPAMVRMRVDDRESEWDVYLPRGIAAGGRQEVIVSLAPGQMLRRERVVKVTVAS